MAKKIRNASILFVVLSVIFLFGLRDYRLVDRDKSNIFEIPGTARMHCIEQLDFYQYQCHFMVQKLPDKKNEIEAMVEEFLERDDVVHELFERDSRTTSLSIRFYFPSMKFPVYFEENKNYFKMDDSISHYTDNLFLIVTLDRLDETTFLFQDTTLEKLNISE